MNDKIIMKTRTNVPMIDVLKIIWSGKILIFVSTFLFSIGAAFLAINLPDYYKSEATLAPSEDSGLKVPGQLGGLAALAGVNLDGMGGGDKSKVAIEILKSRDFLGRFIEENELYIEIMASKGWRRESDEIIIDSKIYDAEKKVWVRDVKPPFKQKPSNLETYEEFKKSLSVNQDKTSGMVKISFEHYSPYLAKKIVDLLILTINEEMRNRDLAEAENSIKYLSDKVEGTKLSGVQSMLFSLIEEQTKTVMLANVRAEYIFKTIDRAVVAEERVKPNRILIVFLGTILGCLLGSILVLVRFFHYKD